MKKLFHTLFLLYGIYALVAFIFFWIDGLLAMIFILICVGASVFLLTIKRNDTEQWQIAFTQKHNYMSPILKICGIYFIYVIISTITSLLAVFVLDFDKQIVSSIDEQISNIVKIIWLLLILGFIVKSLIGKSKKRL